MSFFSNLFKSVPPENALMLREAPQAPQAPGVPSSTMPPEEKVTGADYQERIVSVRGPEMACSVSAVYRATKLLADTMGVMPVQYQKKDFEINRHVKSFVCSGINGISFNDPHIPNAPALQCENVLHERIEQIPVQPKVIHKVAYIKHYNTKTAEEWATLKMRRLSPCGEDYNREMKAKNVDYFFSVNERTAEKEAILGVIPPPSFDEAQGTPIVERKKNSKPQRAKRTNSKKE